LCKDNAGTAPGCGCLSGFFKSDSDTCDACSSKCVTCSSLNVCTSCNDSNKATPSCDCIEGYYISGSTCAQCTGDLCKACNSKLIHFNNYLYIQTLILMTLSYPLTACYSLYSFTEHY
jgi:hypothetical protein